jgi:cytochrome c
MLSGSRVWLLIAASAVAAGCGQPEAGIAAISRYGCGSCHVIPGASGATGGVGPPLTGIGRRLYVAGQLPNSQQNLITWIRHPASVNPKTMMPELGVTPQDARDIADFLYTLK